IHGQLQWTYEEGQGVDGAHWGDLDGDGSDELIVGMNGRGGVHAVSPDGKLLWKVTDIGNVWNQAVISAGRNRAARVIVTEAGGSVRVYDPAGKLLNAIRPRGTYFSQMSAAAVNSGQMIQADGQDAYQIVVTNSSLTIAVDAAGREIWSTSSSNPNHWMKTSFASGDVDGDGAPDWAFLENGARLVLVTASGEHLADVPVESGQSSFGIVTVPMQRGLLISLAAGKVNAYRFDR